jgi:hypothetical protein
MEIPKNIQSLKIEVRTVVRHLFDSDYYNKTEVVSEIYGEAIVDGRRVLFPYRRVWRTHDLTEDMSDFVKYLLEDIKQEQELMMKEIINYAKNKTELIRILKEIGEVSEEYAQNYDDDSEDDSDP